MDKRKFARRAAVLTTLAASGALIANFVAGTGAYFTASQPGSISGNIGTVAVSVSGTAINFANLLPGETQTQTVNVQNTGTGNEDIYVAFDNTNLAWSAVNDFGQYGAFTINGVTYDNLNNKYPDGSPASGVMSSNPDSGCYNVPRVPINYLPHVIKLGTLASGQAWSFNVSFQLNPCMTGGQGANLWSEIANDFSPSLTGPLPLNYAIAAFQPGIDPTNQMNGAGRIVPLSLPIPNYPAGIYQ
jgi:hypothetical protein